MSNCIHAWTDASGKLFPEYLNFSRDGDDAVVTLRESPVNGMNGNTAQVRLPWGIFAAMCFKAAAASVPL